jgi:hypothetical protein
VAGRPCPPGQNHLSIDPQVARHGRAFDRQESAEQPALGMGEVDRNEIGRAQSAAARAQAARVAMPLSISSGVTITFGQTASAEVPIPDFSENLPEHLRQWRLGYYETPNCVGKHRRISGIVH